MATQTLANPASQVDRLRTHFARKLLEQIKYDLVWDQFASEPEDIPANIGSKTIRFFRRRKADATQVQNLTDGTPIATFTEVASGYVDITLAQQGEATRVSDLVTAVDMYNWLQVSIETMREDCALNFDTVARNAVAAGANNSNGLFERFAGVVNTLNSANDFATMAGLSPSQSNFTRGRALAAATQLRVNRIPTINGGYPCIVDPALMFDIRSDPSWLLAAQYDGKQLWNREMITLDGVRYIENTNPFRETVYGTAANDVGKVYSAFFLGKQAFGTPKLAKLGNPHKPQIMIVNTPDATNPLLQYITAGWKAYWNAAVLNTNLANDPLRFCQLRCQSTFA